MLIFVERKMSLLHLAPFLSFSFTKKLLGTEAWDVIPEDLTGYVL